MFNNDITIREIAKEINSISTIYKMASFQNIRKEIHGLQRGNKKRIFDENSADKHHNWVNHYGGRKEMQYNIGFEEIQNNKYLRYGLAFSLEPSPSLHEDEIVETFMNKILRYNEYIALNENKFRDLHYWYWYGNRERSIITQISEIKTELLKPGMFFFIGKYVSVESINYDDILKLFDRILDIYVYVEDNQRLPELSNANLSNKINSTNIKDLEKGLHDIDITDAEKEAIVRVRVGQSKIRQELLLKECKCKICGIDNEKFLIASHIKPWSKSDNIEKYDLDNVFLLCPHHDALFDKGYISFDDEGKIIISKSVSETTKILMNIHENIKIKINEKNKIYLKWHRNNMNK